MYSTTHPYQGHIDTLLHYINSMIQKDWRSETPDAFNKALGIQTLSRIASMSERNLQLIFKAYTNETLHQYIIRLRMEYAMLLLKDGKMSLTDISEHIGFLNPQALSNTFQKKYNTTPTEKQTELQQKISTYPFPISPCIIVEQKEIPILFISYTGNYETCGSSTFEENSWDRLYKYAKQNALLPDKEEYWGICYDDTNITDIDKCRFYACMTINRKITTPLTQAIKHMHLQKGLYAVYQHKGSYFFLEAFYDAILKQLPPDSYLNKNLILERYLNSPQNTEEKELLTEIWLPITYHP